MKTFLYNIETQKREGPIRNGRYLVDGKPGVLPEFMVELEIIIVPDLPYDNKTQALVRRQYADLDNKYWIMDTYVRDLTEEEIEDRKPKPPSECTPRQFRIAMVQMGLNPDMVGIMIDNIEDENERKVAKIEWEYSLVIKRAHPLITTFGLEFGLSSKDIDDLFILAKTFE
jgi:hypothetical protein